MINVSQSYTSQNYNNNARALKKKKRERERDRVRAGFCFCQAFCFEQRLLSATSIRVVSCAGRQLTCTTCSINNTMAKLSEIVICCVALVLSLVSGSFISDGADLMYVEDEDTPQVKWLVPETNEIENNSLTRRKRGLHAEAGYHKSSAATLFTKMPENCQEKLRKLCVVVDKEVDDLFFLECVQTFKVSVFLCL